MPDVDPLIVILTLAAALGCGLIAGVFFAFSAFVMKALARLPASHGIAAMQAINVVVLNRWFLDQMTREELIDEVKRLRQGICRHRDSSRHELCWHHPALWGLLPERTDPIPVVPEWPEFIRGCVSYRQSLDEQAPNAHGQMNPMKGEPLPDMPLDNLSGYALRAFIPGRGNLSYASGQHAPR